MASRGSSTVADAAEQITSLITAENLGTGDQLPSIKELAKRTSYSQSTIREAIRILASEGRVRSEHGSGTYVTSSGIAEMLSKFLFTYRPDAEEVPDLFELQVILIEAVLLRACQQKEATQLKLLAQAFEREGVASAQFTMTTLPEMDARLFRAIASLSDNQIIGGLLTMLRGLSMRAIRPGSVPTVLHAYSEAYTKLLQAVEAANSPRIMSSVESLLTATTLTSREQHSTVYINALGSGSVGGTFFVLGQRISQLLGEAAAIKVAVKLTGGGIENAQLTEAMNTGLAIVQGDVAYTAYNGLGEFAEQHSHIRSIGQLGDLYLHVFVRDDSHIRELSDLAGKTLGVGAQGGASAQVAYGLLRALNLQPDVHFKPRKAAFYDMVTMLGARKIDAAFFLSSVGNDAIIEAVLGHKLRFISLKQAEVKQFLKENRYWKSAVIPALSYPFQLQPLDTIRIPMLLITHSAASDDFSRLVAATLHHHDLLQLPQQKTDVDEEMPLHPGAAEYWAGLQ